MRTYEQFIALDEDIFKGIKNAIGGALSNITGQKPAKAAIPPGAATRNLPKKTAAQKAADLQRAYGVEPRADGKGAKDATGLKGMEGPKSNPVGSVNKDQQGFSNRRGWQSAIKKAEHKTDHDNVYRGRFGTTTLPDGTQTHRGSPVDFTKPHTGETVKSPWSNRTSAAAGAYQAMPDTWSRFMGNAPMTPDNQDRFADKEAAGAGVDLKSDMTRQRVSDLAPKWASFPDAKTGKSLYGQPAKPYEVHRQNFERARDKDLGSQYVNAPRVK